MFASFLGKRKTFDKNTEVSISVLGNPNVGKTTFKLSKNSLTILKKFYTQTNFNKLSELSCYSLFGKVLNYIDINYSFIKDEDWYEINTLKEYTQSFNNKIFKI